MKFTNLKIQNFLSIQKAEVSLQDRGMVLIIGENKDNTEFDSNGAGKSSIIEAMTYALYGKTIRGIKGDSVINNKVGKNCKVSLDFIDDSNVVYRVIRFRKHHEGKNNVLIFRNQTNITPKSDRDTDTFIADLLQMDFTTFTSSILYSAQSFRFTSATDAELKGIFEKMLGLEAYAKAQEVAKTKLKEIQLDIDRETSKLSTSQENHERLLEDAETFSQQSKAHSKMVEEKTKTCNLQIAESSANIKKFTLMMEEATASRKEARSKMLSETSKLKALKERYAEACKENKEEARIKAEIASIKEEIADITADKKATTQEIKAREREASRLEANIKSIDEDIASYETKLKDKEALIGTNCPVCGSTVTKEGLESVSAEIEAMICDLQKDRQDVQHQLTSVQKFIQELEAKYEGYANELDGLNKDLQDFKDDLDSIDHSAMEDLLKKLEDQQEVLTNAKINLSSIDIKIDVAEEKLSMYSEQKERYTKELESLIAEENPFEGLLKETKAKISQLEGFIEAETKLIAKLEDDRKYLEFWAIGFGNQGIKSFLLDSITPFLNVRANQYLNMLSSDHMGIRFTTQTTLKTGEKREKFNIEVENSDGGTSYDSNSSGEKKRVDLAINLAMQDLLASRSNKSMNIACFDEIFDALDESGVENVMNMLNTIAGNKDTIFVISHNEAIKSKFSEIMKIVKKDGLSSIE